MITMPQDLTEMGYHRNVCKYSQTCLKRSLMGSSNSDHIRQVAAYTRLLCTHFLALEPWNNDPLFKVIA